MACSKFTIINLILGFFTILLLTACVIVLFKDHKPEPHQETLNSSVERAENSPLKSTTECEEVCVSKECIYYSSAVLNSLDESKDKCGNFYNYACGMFPRDSHHVDIRKTFTAFRQRSEAPMYARLLRIHETEKTENPASAKTNIIYNTCTQNISGRSEFKKLIGFLNTIFGQWPITNSSYLESDIDNWLSEFFLIGGYYFYTLELITDNYDLLRKVSVAFTSMLPPYLDMYSSIRVAPNCEVIFKSLENCMHGALHDKLMDLLTFTGLSETVSSEILDDVCRIDYMISRACVRPYVTRIRRIDLGHWSTILETGLRKIGSNLNTKRIEKLFFHYDGMEAMQKLLDEEPKTAIANYLAVRFLYTTANQVKFIKTGMDLNMKEMAIANVDTLIHNRKQRCFAFLLSNFPFTFVKSYLQLVDAEQKVELLKSLYTNIRDTAGYLARSVGLSPNFRSTLHKTGYAVRGNLETVDYINYLINMWNNTNMLDDLSPHGDSFVMNVIESYRFQQYDRFLHHDHGRYFLANKYKNHFFAYAGRRLSVEFGFGILEFPTKSDEYMLMNNFAATGFILAHELGDAVTDLLIRSVTHKDVDSTYLKRFLDCLQSSYSGFQIPYQEAYLNGTIFAYENSADVFALEVSYQALKKTIGENLKNIKYPGLDHTFEELFFLFYANSQCEIIDHSGYESLNHNGVSPTEHRVNGPLMYSKGLSRALKCSKESEMNPSKKCWYLM